MKKILKFFPLLLLIACCSEPEEKAVKNYVVVEGSIAKPQLGSLNIVDVRNGEVVHSFDLLEDSSFRDTLFVEEGYYYLSYHDQQQMFYLKPSYDLNLTFDATDINHSITWDGSGGSVNNYLAKKVLLEQDLFERSYYGYYTTLGENDFLRLNDSIHSIKMDLFKKVKDSFDSKFAFIEKKNLKFDRLEKITTYPRMKRTFDDAGFQESGNYPEPFQNIDLSDQSVLNSYHHFFYVVTYLGYQNIDRTKNNDSLDNVMSFLEIVDEQIANEAIRNEMAFYYLKYRLDQSIKLDATYEKFMSISTNEVYNKIIREKYQGITGLAKGKISPDFSFENITGKKIQLSDLKDKAVYIDLWATWCKPCIEEFPQLEKLQKEFEEEDIYFVSVSKDDKHENWKRMVRKKNLGGIQLFASDNDHKFFKEYQVTGIPRFILLDKDNRIVDINAKRPSDPELVEELYTLLQ